MKLSVTVVPKSKVRKVEKVGENSFKVWTTSVPEDGKATKDVIDQLAKHLRIAKSLISLVSGHSSRQKIFQVEE